MTIYWTIIGDLYSIYVRAQAGNVEKVVDRGWGMQMRPLVILTLPGRSRTNLMKLLRILGQYMHICVIYDDIWTQIDISNWKWLPTVAVVPHDHPHAFTNSNSMPTSSQAFLISIQHYNNTNNVFQSNDRVETHGDIEVGRWVTWVLTLVQSGPKPRKPHQ